MKLNMLPLGERDMKLSQIEKAILSKKQSLINKKKELTNKQKDNTFLSGVKDDYLKYHDYIIKEKQAQQTAFILLQEYINDLIKTEKLVDNQLRVAKKDKNGIVNEIDKIKGELDKLMNV